MTESEFQEIFANLHQAIVNKIKSVVPAETKVLGRDVSDVNNEKIWIGRLKDANGKIHCWTVSYQGCDSSGDTAIAANVFTPVFNIIGYHYYEFGTEADNSTVNFAAEINALRYAFMNELTLGQEWVCEHKGFHDQTSVLYMDGQQVHFSKVRLKVQLEPLPYEYA